jgi:hypothetical protein
MRKKIEIVFKEQIGLVMEYKENREEQEEEG